VTGEVVREKLVKEVLTSLLSHKEAACIVRARTQAALHGRADRDAIMWGDA
jgi:hypothetical protein